MLTLCPHCDTLFRVTSEQLEMAAGKVRCCRCQEVFSAPDHMQETEEQLNGHTPADTSPETHSHPEQPEEETTGDEANIPADTTEEEPDREETTLKQVDLSPFLTQTRGKVTEIEPSQAALEGDNGLPFQIPDNIPEIPAAEALNITADGIDAKQRSLFWSTLAGSLTIIFLLLIFLAQLSWFGKKHLMKYPEGQQLLELACRHIGCQLPAEKSTQAFTISDRSITSHPAIESALLVKISFTNEASHPQPYPLIQLSFFGDNEQLSVQRTFKPAEYLHRPADRNGLLQSGEQVDLQLELRDPGKETTGFMFDFL